MAESSEPFGIAVYPARRTTQPASPPRQTPAANWLEQHADEVETLRRTVDALYAGNDQLRADLRAAEKRADAAEVALAWERQPWWRRRR